MITRKQDAALKCIWRVMSNAIESQPNGERIIKEYFAQNITEERGHRRFCPDGLPRDGMTVAQAARLFAVQSIFRALNGENAPPLKDFFHVRRSWFMAHAIAAEFKEILKATTPLLLINRKAILDLDYVELMSHEK